MCVCNSEGKLFNDILQLLGTRRRRIRGKGGLSNSEHIVQYWKHSIILSPEICQSIKYGATSLKVVRQIRANIYTWVNITCKGMDRLSSG